MGSPKEINEYELVDLADYDDCLGVIEHQYCIEGINAKIRMHYIKLDGNGLPMVKALAKMLYTYIIDYCIAARNRPEPLTTRQSAKLTKQARDLFRLCNCGNPLFGDHACTSSSNFQTSFG